MSLLPKGSGHRPRAACEISPDGVVAARAPEATGALAAVARVALGEGAVTPGLKPGNIAQRLAVVAAVRSTLEGVGLRANGRGADITLIIPDGAVRVLLLDFDALPGKLSEALPIVRFRLKKLLPFEADDAMITYQVQAQGRAGVQVLAAAVPRDVLAEYETVVREAGFDPGVVLPSTLAALPAVPNEYPALLVNANSHGITTAITSAGHLLLHRSVDLGAAPTATPAGSSPQLYAEDDAFPRAAGDVNEPFWSARTAGGADEFGAGQVRDMYASSSSHRLQTEPRFGEAVGGTVLANAQEMAHAVSVAAAYFEDTLSQPPRSILSAGAIGAETLSDILRSFDVSQVDGLQTRELVEAGMLAPDAARASVPRSALAGVAGALRA